ncbi:MAG: flagellar assembly protein FliW [Oscillospiraceae bacterium]|jgi:flagellar assembly factor FliW|nr:flagellar assembly protein FliW [Oscillospiraceae bacterium]
MNILTRDFGEIEVAPEDIITFVSPMFGFEEMNRYVFLFAEENTNIVWLQSVDNPHICFILADPKIVEDNYNPRLSPEVRGALGEGDYLFWLVVVVAEDFRDSTINMKSPVVVNLHTKRAVQTILEEDYPLRRPLAGSQEGR